MFIKPPEKKRTLMILTLYAQKLLMPKKNKLQITGARFLAKVLICQNFTRSNQSLTCNI